ncbi:MAG: ATP-grasp domain-containing protein [Ignavibacteria bacterium]|nr:ATP-grasp domain-containing protein [Ignavibacteria bacterium]
MTFIGPTPEAIAMLGDKTAARDLAIASKVPISPGSDGAVASFDDARAVVERIGYPVIIKAAAGGGGKGMRIVEEASEIESAFRAAQNDEALTSFNDGRVFIERYIVEPVTSKFRSWRIITGRCCGSRSGNVRCSADIKRWSRSRLQRQ